MFCSDLKLLFSTKNMIYITRVCSPYFLRMVFHKSVLLLLICVFQSSKRVKMTNNDPNLVI